MEVVSDKPPRFPTAKGPATDGQLHILTPWLGNRGWDCRAAGSGILAPVSYFQTPVHTNMVMCTYEHMHKSSKYRVLKAKPSSFTALAESWQLPLGQSERTTENKPELHLTFSSPEKICPNFKRKY